jgi:nucleotide-binding universal stress UspA family protein
VSSPESAFEIGTDGPSLILVGLDGSRTSMRAGAYAAGLARRQGCRLLAVYVGQVSAGASMYAGAAGALAQASRQLADELAETVLGRAAEAGIDAEFRPVSGDPFTELTRIAEQERADAVVVGTSEHAGHRVVGSLATRLVRAGKWPVIVVP